MKNIILINLLSLVSIAYSQDTQRLKHFNIKDGLAIEGYDPISFFEGEPMKGKKKYSSRVHGVVYFFATTENKSRFDLSPSKYEPAFGGWCAYAMGHSGEKVKIDPETYKIVDDRLYLFYNFWGNNTLDDWNKDETSLDLKARKAWKKWLAK